MHYSRAVQFLAQLGLSRRQRGFSRAASHRKGGGGRAGGGQVPAFGIFDQLARDPTRTKEEHSAVSQLVSKINR